MSKIKDVVDIKDDKFFGSGSNRWLGIVLPMDSQEQQMMGTGGYSYRRRVAIMGYHPSSRTEIKDSQIAFALVAASVTDGSGAGNRSRSVRITQGDVVVGEFYGEGKQEPVITGVLTRTKGVELNYGKGRFDTKTGYVGSTVPLPLTSGPESSEDAGPCGAAALTPSKTDATDQSEKSKKAGVPTEPTVDAIPDPEESDEVKKLMEEEGLTKEEAKEKVADNIEAESDEVPDYTVMGVTYDGNTGLPKEIPPDENKDGVADVPDYTVMGVTYDGNTGKPKNIPPGELDDVSPAVQEAILINRGSKMEKTTKKTISTTRRASGRFDFNTGKAYINNQEVSIDEYTKFQNMSLKEQKQQYGQIESIKSSKTITLSGNQLQEIIDEKGEEGVSQAIDKIDSKENKSVTNQNKLETELKNSVDKNTTATPTKTKKSSSSGKFDAYYDSKANQAYIGGKPVSMDEYLRFQTMPLREKYKLYKNR